MCQVSAQQPVQTELLMRYHQLQSRLATLKIENEEVRIITVTTCNILSWVLLCYPPLINNYLVFIHWLRCIPHTEIIASSSLIDWFYLISKKSECAGLYHCAGKQSYATVTLPIRHQAAAPYASVKDLLLWFRFCGSRLWILRDIQSLLERCCIIYFVL